MKSFYLTDAGKVRSHNEDSVIVVKNKDNNYLMAVADGMGGHSCGEVASNLVIKYLSHEFNENFKNKNKEQAINWINDKVEEVNNEIFKYVSVHPESKGMGTTLVMAIITNEYILLTNIGDSSGFVMKKGKLHKITYDHTLVNLLVSAGELTKEQALNHPRKNILVKALGASNLVEADIFDCDMSIDSVLLTSDGVTNMLSNDILERVLVNKDLDIENKLVRIVDKCNNRGGFDNISVAYLVRNEKEVEVK